MKIRNDDLVKLNELKFDFLSPPYTFKLAAIAVANIETALEIMSKYVPADNNYIKQLTKIKTSIQADVTDMTAVKQFCKEAAVVITRFTAA
jgi:hypothetical protein